MQGRVKYFNEGKGYGFIESHDGSGDQFVHVTNVVGGTILQPGDIVEFQMGTSRKTGRTQAVEVRLLHSETGPVRFGDAA